MDYPVSLVLAGDTALQAFYRPDAGYVSATLGAVGTLNDRTANARHATQSTGAKKPTLDTTTYRRPCVSAFGGQVLEIAATLATAMPATGYTVWFVCKPATTAGNQGVAAVGALGGYAGTIEAAKWNVREQGHQVVVDGAASTAQVLIAWQRISGVDHMSVNGIEVTLTGNAAVGTPSGLSTLLALLADLTFPFDGDLFEAGFMSRLLSGGAPGVGNTVTGELAHLLSYFHAWYQV